MSAREIEHGEHDHSSSPVDGHGDGHGDNYEAAYGAPATGADAAPIPPTPEHGFWRSLAELEGKGRLQTDRGGNELPPAPEVSDPLSRRNFFRLMGASMALAGVGACRRYEKDEIVPLAVRPEDQVPGATMRYATAFDLGGVGHALLATSYEGRPIKLDGNPEHPFASGRVVDLPGADGGRVPVSRAGAHVFAQAAILGLYDPDRSQSVLAGNKGASMESFRAQVAELRKKLSGARILAEASSSPTLRRLRELLSKRYEGLQWHEYEPISWDNERLGTKLAFGHSVRPIARLDACRTIVTIDCDLFVEHPAAMRYSRDYARSRRRGGKLGPGQMNRLWSAESTLSNTGAMADHRLPIRSEHGLPFAMALGAALGVGQPPTSELRNEAKFKKFVDVLAEELRENTGRAVVIAGRRQPPEVHALVAQINQRLGAPGQTLDYYPDPDADRAQSHVASIQQLARDMAAGQVGALIMIGGNPVYDAPADLDFAAALAKVGTSIHLHEYVNETSQKVSWHVPRAHFLEAWGDARTWDGAVAIAQPLIAPLYGGLSAIELLALLLDDKTPAEALVSATHGGDWRRHVHDGHVPAAEPSDATPEPPGRPLTPDRLQLGVFAMPPLTPSQQAGSAAGNGKLEVVFHYSSFTYDGRFANNAWLQETPDFLTKVTWDNYALVGPDTAEALGVANDTMIRVKLGDREVTVPCYTIPGQARSSIALVLGGGRTAAGRVGGEGGRTVGVDTNKVRTTGGFDVAVGATVTATGDRYELASVQEHWDIRTIRYGFLGGGGGLKPSVNEEGLQKRLPELIKQVTNQELGQNPSWSAEGGAELYFDDEEHKRHLSLFHEREYSGHRWGMAIDLSTCTGCNACMVACQSENNVPVVGRAEIFNNREMHWIRIDRYFQGPPSDPLVVHQPIACQQCENAPCEQVCPVGATVHSDEGLNDMTYNRCIGTRYCANNCPYKVRRFNFLDWNKEWREARNKVRRLLFNPDVTVRMRGVMEKCTFCVQRIQNAKIHARAEVRSHQRPGTVDAPLRDGEIESACQAACPTEAIVFGDLADPKSRVSQLHEDGRSYALLPDLYTKPRNRFLARVRNPNPKMNLQDPSKQPAAGGPRGGH